MKTILSCVKLPILSGKNALHVMSKSFVPGLKRYLKCRWEC